VPEATERVSDAVTPENVYADARRARSYADLQFPGTYYLAFRDLPDLISRHVVGCRALDFGCGAGRSTRFLRGLGFDVIGVDVADSMLEEAKARDPVGDYRRIPIGSLGPLAAERFDLVLCAFTFDNVPNVNVRRALFEAFRGALTDEGRIVNLVSAPEIYVHEWTSFSTRDFPENASARSGELVRIVMLDVEDQRPVEDAYWTDGDYRQLYETAGLEVIEKLQPLGRASDPFEWVTESRISPWAIYVLGAGG
jgi:SAM-dependent methyltransferase